MYTSSENPIAEINSFLFREFKPESGGQYHRILQRRVPVNLSIIPFPILTFIQIAANKNKTCGLKNLQFISHLASTL
ncbi:MAG: hypothetical protein ACYCOO_01375 [Chitinophagaceae bacterium]